MARLLRWACVLLAEVDVIPSLLCLPPLSREGFRQVLALVVVPVLVLQPRRPYGLSDLSSHLRSFCMLLPQLPASPACVA